VNSGFPRKTYLNELGFEESQSEKLLLQIKAAAERLKSKFPMFYHGWEKDPPEIVFEERRFSFVPIVTVSLRTRKKNFELDIIGFPPNVVAKPSK